MEHHHPIVGAHSCDENYVRNAIQNNKRTKNGLYYEVSLPAQGGVHLTVFTTIETHRNIVDDAIVNLKMKREIHTSTALLIPNAWLE